MNTLTNTDRLAAHAEERARREAARGNSCRACQMTLRATDAEAGLCYLCRAASPCSARND